MKHFCKRKSTILLTFLILASAIQYILFHLSTGTLLLFLLTFITAIHTGLKELKKRRPGKAVNLLSGMYRLGLLVVGILSILILVLVTHPIKECRKIDPQKIQSADTMIILGAGLNGDQVSKRLKLRLDKALKALTQNPTITVIVSGGQGSDELISEAEAMKNYLVSRGADPKQIIEENRSTSTYENFLYSKALYESMKLPKKVLIVTSDFHVFRSQMIASSLGFTNEVLCSQSEWYVVSNYLIREIPAVVNDFIKTLPRLLKNR